MASKAKKPIFKPGPFVPPTSDPTLVRDAITGIPLYFDVEITRLMLLTAMHQHKGAENSLSAALESLADLIVKKVMNTPDTILQITNSIIDDHELIKPIAVVFDWKQRV